MKSLKELFLSEESLAQKLGRWADDPDADEWKESLGADRAASLMKDKPPPRPEPYDSSPKGIPPSKSPSLAQKTSQEKPEFSPPPRPRSEPYDNEPRHLDPSKSPSLAQKTRQDQEKPGAEMASMLDKMGQPPRPRLADLYAVDNDAGLSQAADAPPQAMSQENAQSSYKAFNQIAKQSRQAIQKIGDYVGGGDEISSLDMNQIVQNLEQSIEKLKEFL